MIHVFIQALVHVHPVNMCVCTYLKVGELRVVEVGVDVQRGAHHQQGLKLVQGGADVAGEAQAPDLQKSLQVKEHSEGHLGGLEETAISGI